MNKRILGKTGLQVSELALGGLFVSSHGAQFEQGKAAVRRSLELGINYIDTAPTYFNSEEVLGKSLQDINTPVILSTKIGGRPQPFDPKDHRCLMCSVEESLKLLKRDTIDILFIHEPDRPLQYDWWADIDSVYGPVIDFLDELKADGVIRFTGLGGTTAYEMAHLIRSGRFDVVLTAFQYNMLWREAANEIIPEAKKHSMGIVIGSPLQQGVLARRFDDEVRAKPWWMSKARQRQLLALYDLVDELDISLPELGLRFVLSNMDISCTLTGVRSVEEIESSVIAAEKGPLPPEVLMRLDQIAAMVPYRPSEERLTLPLGQAYRGPRPLY